MPIANLKNVNLYYEVYGQGEPLVLVSGLSLDMNLWRAVVPEFEQHYQVIVLDNRGVGRTESQGDFSVEDMASDIIHLLDHLKIDKAHFMGSSMGGCIVQTIAKQYPNRVNKLIVSNSSAHFNAVGQLALSVRYDLLKMGVDMPTMVKVAAPWSFSDAFLSQPGSIEKLIELRGKNPYPQTLENFKKQLDALFAFDSRGWLNQISATTLVIAGEEDLLAPVAYSKELIAGIKGAQLKVLPRCHAPMVEIPHDYAKVVLAFLSEKST